MFRLFYKIPTSFDFVIFFFYNLSNYSCLTVTNICDSTLLFSQGIWKSLEIEMGRPSNNIGNRYRKLLKTYLTTTTENGVVVTPLDVTSYLPNEVERKLAAALAPVRSAASSSQVPESAFLEAATAAAVLAGKKRGRPRTNPLPISLSSHATLSHTAGLASSDSSDNGDGGAGEDGDGDGDGEGGSSSSRSKRQRAELLESLSAISQATSGAGGAALTGSIPANVPINASAEVAAGRTKIGRSSFWNEERVSKCLLSRACKCLNNNLSGFQLFCIVQVHSFGSFTFCC